MAGLLLRAAMWSQYRVWRQVERLTARPDLTQRDALRRLLSANRETHFNREHRLTGVVEPAEFQARVPVQDFESLRPYVDEQRRTGVPALTAEAPLFYVQTSGTTGQPKLIPVTPTMLRIHRDEQRLFTYLQYRACPAAFEGKALGIMGAAEEGRLDSGHAVGSVSGHLYQSLPKGLRSRFVVPPDVSRIADYDLKYLVVLRLALAEPSITYLGTPNPSTFLRLLSVLSERRDELVDSLENGRLDRLQSVEPAIRQSIVSRIRPAPARAALLRGLADPTFASLWPDIRLVTTWTGGSCGIALDALRRTLPERASVMELGYQASECRGTMALELESAAGLPPLHHHFFEFVEQAAWDNGRPEFLMLDQLADGKRYYILVTTAAGLYRYFMNDLVEVAGFHHRTPLLRFVQKGKGVTSLTGEKLYEAQAIAAVRSSAGQLTFVPTFFLMVADERDSRYRVFIEVDANPVPDAQLTASAVDHHLGALNMEYQGKRQSSRLLPPTVTWLRRGAGEAYKAACVRAGQREGQFKPLLLQYDKDLAFRFGDYVL